MDEFQEFLAVLQKRGSNKHLISHCLGTRDAWKWVRKNKWKEVGGEPFDQLLYSKIINDVNLILAEKLLEGHEIEFPYRMGSLMLSSMPTRVQYEGDTIVTNYRTDWKKTLLLWFEDKEARDSHKFIKRIQKEIYYIRYFKTKANYRNKRFYSFRPNRNLLRSIGKTFEKMKLNAIQFDYS